MHHPVDGRNPAAVEVGKLSHDSKCFIHPRWCRISTIWRVLEFVLNVRKQAAGHPSKWSSQGTTFLKQGGQITIVQNLLETGESRHSFSDFFSLPCVYLNILCAIIPTN